MEKMNNQKRKELPILFKSKENCCGCASCYAICPTNAIDMKCDEEGFLYPYVHSETCIRCYQCISVCAFKRDQKLRGLYEESYQ